MPVIPIKSSDDFQRIITSDKVVVIDFWATWCGPCRAISPMLEKFSNVAGNSAVEFYKLDVDDQPAISQEVGIRAMPTFIVYKDGVKQCELIGADPQKLEQLVSQAVSLM